MTAAKVSIIPEFLEKIELLDLQDAFTITNDSIKNNLSGSEIIFKGIKTSSGDQTAALKSLQGITTWVLDEAEELTDETIFDKIDLSVRQKGIQNRVILIMNPTTKAHWIYKRFFEDMGIQEGTNQTKQDTTYIHTTYLDNVKNLDTSFLKQVERIKKDRPSKYKHQILGGWMDKAEGVVFTNWAFGEFNPHKLQTTFGIDFGFSVDPDALVEVAIDKARHKIYLKEHYYKTGTNIQTLAEVLLKRAGRSLVISEVDPRLTSELKSKGVNIKPHTKGKIETGITLMLDYDIIIDPQSNNLAKELNNYAYADKGSKLYVDDYNHLIDAARYNIEHHLRDPNKGRYNIR